MSQQTLTITLKRLADCVQSGAWKRLADDKFLPLATVFRLNALARQVTEAYNNFDQRRATACERFGGKLTQQGDALMWVFPDNEQAAAANTELTPLLAEKVDLVTRPFALKDFKPRPMDAGQFLSANDITQLDWLICVGDDTTVPTTDEPPQELAQEAAA